MTAATIAERKATLEPHYLAFVLGALGMQLSKGWASPWCSCVWVTHTSLSDQNKLDWM